MVTTSRATHYLQFAKFAFGIRQKFFQVVFGLYYLLRTFVEYQPLAHRIAYKGRFSRQMRDFRALYFLDLAYYQSACQETNAMDFDTVDYRICEEPAFHRGMIRKLIHKIRDEHTDRGCRAKPFRIRDSYVQSKSSIQTDLHCNRFLTKNEQEIRGYTSVAFWPPRRLGPSDVGSVVDGMFYASYYTTQTEKAL